MIQTAMEERVRGGFSLTEEADGGKIASHVASSVHGGFSCELPECGQIHLYFLESKYVFISTKK